MLNAEKEKVKAWCRQEQERGIELCGEDLLDQFMLEVEDLVFNIDLKVKLEQEKAASRGVLQVTREEILSTQELAKYAQAGSTLAAADKDRSNKGYYKETLCHFCDVVERKPDLVFPMTIEESKLVCELSWQAFDRILHILVYGDADELKSFVQDVDEFMKVSKLGIG